MITEKEIQIMKALKKCKMGQETMLGVISILNKSTDQKAYAKMISWFDENNERLLSIEDIDELKAEIVETAIEIYNN